MKATDDTQQDTEPTVVAEDTNGATYTVSAAIKYFPNQVDPSKTFGRVETASTTTLAPGSFIHRTPPMPINQFSRQLIYLNSSDPLLAANVSSGGTWPKRIYCVSLLFNTGNGTTPSAIGVWQSDTGGTSWAGPAIVAASGGGGHLLDKPGIAVSAGSSSLGDVYVTWNNADTGNGYGNQIYVARSTDGGSTFEAAVPVRTPSLIYNPSLAVNSDSDTGDVSVVWDDFIGGTVISAATSSGIRGQPLQFGTSQIITDSGILSGTVPLNGGVKASTVPRVRYDWVDKRLIVAWHGYSSGPGSTTDIYYSYTQCSPSCTGSWATPRPINDYLANDQFMPALDFDSLGNATVTFYDRRNDPANVKYQPYYAYIHSDGTSVQANQNLDLLQSDPTLHTQSTGDANFVGDYQDVVVWAYPDGEHAVAAWIGITDATVIGDVFLTRVRI